MDHQDPLHVDHRDSRLQGMVRDVRLGIRLPDTLHATKGRHKEWAKAVGNMAGMDRGMDKDRDKDRDKDKGVAVLVDNMDKDTPQRTEMKSNQVRMPCDQPPVIG